MRPAVVLRSLLTLTVLGAAIACADNALPTAPRSVALPPLSLKKAKDGAKVAKCKKQKEDFASATIGSEGGTLSVGKNTLEIPAGALSGPTEISAHLPKTYSAQVEFAPEGLHFAVPARLTMSYGACSTPLVRVQIAYLQADTVTEVELSRDHVFEQTVTAHIGHFSSYAVAY